jgi:hypothetical protein
VDIHVVDVPQGASDFVVTITIHSDAIATPTRYKPLWDCTFFRTSGNPIDDPEVWEKAFNSVPLERRSTYRIHFIRRYWTSFSEKVGAEDFAMSATSEWDLPAGTYEIRVFADDGVRVYLDDDLILKHWNSEQAIKKSLSGGHHRIRVEYVQIKGWCGFPFRFRKVPVE